MIRITKLFAIAGFLIPAGLTGPVTRAQTVNPREVLWYRTAAPVWDNAPPIGNGRLGAMVFGGANAGSNNGDLQASPKNAPLVDGSQTFGADEHLQLNESSLWRGSRADRLNPRAHDAVAQIRKLLLDSNGLMARRFRPPRRSMNHRLAVPLKNPRAGVTSGAQTVYMSCQVHAKE